MDRTKKDKVVAKKVNLAIEELNSLWGTQNKLEDFLIKTERKNYLAKK